LIFEFLSLFDQSLDILFRKAALIVGNGNFSIGVGSLVSGLDVHDSVGVNFKGNFNLRDSSRSRRDSIKVELSQEIVVLGHLPLSFKDLDEDSWLIVTIGCEDL